jgi:hypothetical protein
MSVLLILFVLCLLGIACALVNSGQERENMGMDPTWRVNPAGPMTESVSIF